MPLTIEYDENGQLKAVKEVSQAELDYQYNKLREASLACEEKMHKERIIE